MPGSGNNGTVRTLVGGALAKMRTRPPGRAVSVTVTMSEAGAAAWVNGTPMPG